VPLQDFARSRDSDSNRQLLPRHINRCRHADVCSSDQPRQRTRRCQHPYFEVQPPAHACVGCKPLEILRGVPEGHAAVALAVLVPAFIALTLVPSMSDPGVMNPWPSDDRYWKLPATTIASA
jgi:hypothetical protein